MTSFHFTGTIANVERFGKFGFVVNEEGQEAFLGRYTVINSGFKPEMLTADSVLELQVVEGNKGLRAQRVIFVDGKTATTKKKSAAAHKKGPKKAPEKTVKTPTTLPTLPLGESFVGTIHSFQRGFGFIKVEGYNDIFFHVKDTKVSKVFILPGVNVEFWVSEGSISSRAMITGAHFLGDFDGFIRNQVDAYGEGEGRKVVIEITKIDVQGKLLQVHRGDKDGEYLGTVETLAEARKMIGKTLTLPPGKGHGIKTNDPSLSQSAKGRSGGGGRQGSGKQGKNKGGKKKAA